jgi:hypothetical protein
MKAFDSLAPARSPVRPSRPSRSAPVGSVLRDAYLLHAFFESSGFAVQLGQHFTGEME